MNNLIAKLRAKKDSKKGFTLMEMLIVVAIIAILVAVSIPVFTSQLTKAREAVDTANMRAAKAVVATHLLTDDLEGAADADKLTVSMYYSIDDGHFINEKPKAYGKTEANKLNCIELTAYDTTAGTYTLEWVAGETP